MKAAEMEIRVLGSLEVVGDDGPIPLPAGKQRQLLAALVMRAGETCSADGLIDALWGASPPASAAKLLQVYVSQLRAALGPEGERIKTRTPGYLITVGGDELDSGRFERLLAEGRAALAEGNPARARRALGQGLQLWRGPALADFVYDDFARAEAGRLEELRLEALEERVEADLARGLHSDVVGELRALVGEHPLRERLWRLTMLALYRCGRRAEALECYGDAVRTLRDQLGLDPGEELRRLQQAVLRHDPALALESPPTTIRTNVAARLTPLVGREQELVDLRELVVREEVRLVTLSGAGGSGKTSLALELARRVQEDFANGVFVVELAPVRDATLVPAAIAAALRVEPPPGRTWPEAVESFLRTQELLLVVDNLEHLPDAGPLLVGLLGTAPRLTILTTSRVVLHLSGERVYAVQPLAPEAGVELFLTRAQAAALSFAPTNADREIVRAICARLDHLPLAIELAAPRIATLSIGALLDRLAQRLPLLTGGPRDLPDRQQTLRDTIEWSYGLLDRRTQTLLARLSLFAGGFTLGAAEAVCEREDVLDGVATLLDANLLRRRSDGADRFELLETVREFAEEKLDAFPDTDDVRRRHALFFLAVAEGANLNVGKLAPGGERVDIALAEQDNLRAALTWLIASGSIDDGLALTTALEQLWVLIDPREGMRQFGTLLARPEADAVPADLRAHALRAFGSSTYIAGDYEAAELLWRESLVLFEQLGDEGGRAVLLHRLGLVEMLRGDLERARELVEAGHAIHVSRGDRWGEAQTVGTLGAIARDAGDAEHAYPLIERSAALAREVGVPWWESGMLAELAQLLLNAGRLDEAETRAREALGLADVLRDRSGLVFGVGLVAQVAAERGRLEHAGELWGAIEDEDAVAPLGGWRRHRRACETRLREAAGPEFERGYAAGRLRTLDEAVSLALANAAAGDGTR